MPTRQVALIRGINVGKAKRVSMADLRALVEGLGYRDVRTLLNSGNVVFTSSVSPAIAAKRIEQAMENQLGVSARVFVLTAQELQQIVKENSLAQRVDNPSRLLVAAFGPSPDRSKLKALEKEKHGNDALAVGTRAAYLWCPDGILESRLIENVTRVLGDGTTTRNWATILKLQAALDAKT
jgi:uncharacterized protein (DUF1697 family)